MQTTEGNLTTAVVTAEFLDQERTGEGTQYANAPLDPKNVKFIINETIIQQVQRSPLDIQKWRNAHRNAESVYYPNRTWLYDLYDDSKLDGHYTGIITKRWDTVLNKKIEFKKGGKLQEEFTNLINSTAFRLVCRTILEAQEWGISGIEFVPGKEFAPRLIDRKHIKPKWQIISFEQSGKEGISYVDARNILIVGEPEDLGFMLKCVPYIIYKRNCFGDWAQYIEIFGQPIRIMYYDAHDQQAKIELKQTLDASGGSLALMIPKGVEFDIKDGKVTNGDGKLQQNLIDTCNRETSVVVLGNTETTTNGQTGTGAKSKVHKDQQDEICKSDLFYLNNWLNSPQFLQILKSYGYPVEGGRFEIPQEISIEYLKERISIDIQLPEDLPIADDYWYATYNIPKPDNYKELKKKLEDKQKVLKGVDDIATDQENVPAKKPAQKPTKKELKALKAILAQYDPKRKAPNASFGIIKNILRFFAQARRGE
jgi:hypothetical protein